MLVCHRERERERERERGRERGKWPLDCMCFGARCPIGMPTTPGPPGSRGGLGPSRALDFCMHHRRREERGRGEGGVCGAGGLEEGGEGGRREEEKRRRRRLGIR